MRTSNKYYMGAAALFGIDLLILLLIFLNIPFGFEEGLGLGFLLSIPLFIFGLVAVMLLIMGIIRTIRERKNSAGLADHEQKNLKPATLVYTGLVFILLGISIGRVVDGPTSIILLPFFITVAIVLFVFSIIASFK